MKTRSAKHKLRHRLATTLGCSGLALATTYLAPAPTLASGLIWNANPDVNDWTAGTFPTLNPEINFFTVEQVFPADPNQTFNGVRIRIRVTPLESENATTNGPGLLSSTNDPEGEDRFNNLTDDGGATGGADPQSSLSIGLAGSDAVDTDLTIRIDVIYEDLNGNPIPVENSEFAIVDVDSDDSSLPNLWQDEVTVFGYSDANQVLPGNLPATFIAPNISEIPSVNITDDLDPPGANPTYTISGNVVSGIEDADVLNTAPGGNVFMVFDQSITQARFDYGYGSDGQGSLGPFAHGIGLYNVFFSPVLIGTTKTVANTVEEADGTFTVTYQVVVENAGEVELQNVQAIEDLTGTFAAAQDFSVIGIRLVETTGTSSPAPNINPNFNGTNDTNLLDGTGSLSAREVDNDDNSITTPGGTVTVEFDVNITPGDGPNGFGPFENQVEARGTSPEGTEVRDLSTDGTNADANNNGTPTDDDTPTVADVGSPEIGLAKAISPATPVAGQPGFFDFDITYTVTNTGATPLSDVQITDDLQEVLVDNPAVNGADDFSVQDVVVNSFSGDPATAPTANTAYDGDADQNLFTDDPNTFAVGDTATIALSVRVDLSSDGLLEAQNSATATGTDPDGDPTTDTSQNGSDVDPDGDGDPTNNDEPTPIQVGNPQIGLAKAISPILPVPGQPGFFDFDIAYVVANTGDTVLTNVQVTDDLQAVLIDSPTSDGADGFTVQNVVVDAFSGDPANAPTANTAYDGNADQNLFTTAPNVFAAGDTATVTVSVRVDLRSDGLLATENSATATGIDPNGGTVSDTSQNGPNVDPDGNLDPTDNNDPSPIESVSPEANLVLVKRITGVFRQGTAVPVQGIGSFNDQPDDATDTDLRDAFAAIGVPNQPAGLFELPSGFELQPNDEVEYTVFFWNDSASVVNQLQICDELQPPSVLNTAAGFDLAPVGPLAEPFFGNAGGVVQGQSPGAPLADFCISAPGIFPFGPPGPAGGLGVGAGGGVTAGEFTVPANEFGAIRFRVRLP
ncbi:MAG: hypothetical protein AAFN08_02870 [Cyanobacteria bacterium J06559_3]